MEKFFKIYDKFGFSGFFAYTSGCVIIVEDLNAGSQQHLIGLSFSLVFL